MAISRNIIPTNGGGVHCEDICWLIGSLSLLFDCGSTVSHHFEVLSPLSVPKAFHFGNRFQIRFAPQYPIHIGLIYVTDRTENKYATAPVRRYWVLLSALQLIMGVCAHQNIDNRLQESISHVTGGLYRGSIFSSSAAIRPSPISPTYVMDDVISPLSHLFAFFLFFLAGWHSSDEDEESSSASAVGTSHLCAPIGMPGIGPPGTGMGTPVMPGSPPCMFIPGSP